MAWSGGRKSAVACFTNLLNFADEGHPGRRQILTLYSSVYCHSSPQLENNDQIPDTRYLGHIHTKNIYIYIYIYIKMDGGWIFSKTYKDQNDRNGKLYRFKMSFDLFSLENQMISRNQKKNQFFIIPPYF